MPSFREYLTGYYQPLLKVEFDFSKLCDVVESGDKTETRNEWCKFRDIYITPDRQDYAHFMLMKCHIIQEFSNELELPYS